MKIVPLAMTQVNWQVMIEIGKEVLGISPTRGLDAIGTSLESPASFLAALGFDNEPIEALKQQKYFDHFSISFIGVLSAEDIVDIMANTNLNIIAVEGKGRYKRERLAIFTATMDKWVQSCFQSCNQNISYEIRECFCDVTDRLIQFGFSESFNQFKRIDLGDGTFELRRK